MNHRPPDQSEPWHDSKPVEEYLNLSNSRVLELARLRQIPCLPIPSDKPKGRGRTTYKFRMSDIVAWADKRSRAWSKLSRRVE